MKAKISEIFRSIQGEGKYIGVNQVFVRFYECNMNCSWCDTPTSVNKIPADVNELSVADATAKICELSQDCHSISFTGGEPLLQKEFLKELLLAQRNKNNRVYLETNGILHEALELVVDLVDIVSMDFKLPSSTGEKDRWGEHEEFLKKCSGKEVFVKMVVTGQTIIEDIEKTIKIISRIDPCTMLVLQPETSEIKNGSLEKCIEFQPVCKQVLKDVRIIPQAHKFMEVR